MTEVDQLCCKGINEVDNGNYELALKYFKAAEKLNPNDKKIKKFIIETEYLLQWGI